MEATTDLVSNNILIEALRTPEGRKGVLRGKLPRTTLPAFLHEVTHWCFLSPIGATAAALRIRSDEELWRAKTREDIHHAARWRVISEMLNETYRPLSEGLALFAQHYLRMTPDGLASEPLAWTTAHFLEIPDLDARLRKVTLNSTVPRSEDIPDELFEEFCARTNALLDDVQTAQDQVDEVARLATSRLDAAGGGYLPGLLIVKRAFNCIARTRPDLAATTLFLAWAKSSCSTTPSLHSTWAPAAQPTLSTTSLGALAGGLPSLRMTVPPAWRRSSLNWPGRHDGR